MGFRRCLGMEPNPILWGTDWPHQVLQLHFCGVFVPKGFCVWLESCSLHTSAFLPTELFVEEAWAECCLRSSTQAAGPSRGWQAGQPRDLDPAPGGSWQCTLYSASGIYGK